MNRADFAFLARVLKERSGLVMTEEKSYLLESRLVTVVAKHGYASVGRMVAALRLKGDAALFREIIEAMTTNESFFFRDTKPFEQFRTIVLPELLQRRGATGRLRIWSAACAAGQEPYSLAMILAEERARLAGAQVTLLASDISGEMVERATAATYSQFEVGRGLPLKYLVRYFEPDSDRWQLKPEIRRMVQIRTINLLDDLSGLGRFDAIFCRNVAIYFGRELQQRLLARFAQLLVPGGLLVVGHSESFPSTHPGFRSCGRTAYQRVPG
jgi:chemotaxis protein methyltransferase CheR